MHEEPQLYAQILQFTQHQIIFFSNKLYYSIVIKILYQMVGLLILFLIVLKLENYYGNDFVDNGCKVATIPDFSSLQLLKAGYFDHKIK